MAAFKEYPIYDGTGLAELVRAGAVKPSELVEAAVERIEAWNPRLNAVIEKCYDAARREGAGTLDPTAPFCGVPFLVKDLVMAWKGLPMRCGTRILRDFVPDHDAELAVRFRKAGVIALGKTNVPEFGLLPVTEPESFGPTRNPWDFRLTSGGSSGGSAAAVAARMVPVAHGDDGGGSIRIPASCCGVVGLKPTRGRNPMGPDRGDAWQGCAVGHVLTRSVRDCAAMLDATCGPDAGAPYFAPPPARPFLAEAGTPPGRLRIAFTGSPLLGSTVHPDCLAALASTVALLGELGHEVFEAAPEIDKRGFSSAFMTMISAETSAEMEEARQHAGRRGSGGFEATTRVLDLLARSASASTFAKALRVLHRTSRSLGAFFESRRIDVLLTPTLAGPPLPVGALAPTGLQAAMLEILARLNSGRLAAALAGIDRIAEQAFEFIPWTALFNVSGQPALSLPHEWNAAGLPIGMHYIGGYADEATLFRLAGQLEEARPWSGREPVLPS